jgi:hypothetical protein
LGNFKRQNPNSNEDSKFKKMKASKERHDQEWGTWKPVRLTRSARHSIFKALERGVPTGELAGRIPFPQLEAIWREFSPGPGKPKPSDGGPPRGKMGNRWYCENGCGTVMIEKKENEVFVAGKQGARYFCKDCLENHQRKGRPLSNEQPTA